MGSALTGSAPKASFDTQPTIQPSQNDLLNQLVSMFTTGASPPGVQPYGGSFAAPLNSLQNTSLAGLENAASGVAAPAGPTAQQSGAVNSAFNTLDKSLNFQAPTIDSTEAFQKGVVDPLTTNFNTQVLPGLDARFAGSAGGAFSSGRQQQDLTAANQFNTQLSQAGSTFAYNTAAANQQAELQANQQRLAALGLAPQTSLLPEGIATANQGVSSNVIDQLLKTLSGGSVPYNVAQTQVAGQYGEFGRQQDSIQQFLKDMIAAATGQTQTTIGVGTGGSSGLLGGLLGGVGGGLTKLAFSDERLKEDLEEIGDVDGIPLYRYRYIGGSEPQLGFLAQDVEKRVPAAVHKFPGTDLRMVDYGAVIADVLEAA